MATIFTTGDNNFGTAKWIVNATAGLGTHTTIATAITSAASGDTIFVMPGTYTENLTLKIGVSLTSFLGNSLQPTVSIVGKSTFTGAGTTSISNIRLTTNSDFFLVVSGSAASIVNLNNCYLNASNNTGISYTSSSGSSSININDCQGDLGTTGIKYFASSGSGNFVFNYTILSNSGGSSTSSTISAGALITKHSEFDAPITTSGTATLSAAWTLISTAAQNVTSLTAGGSGSHGLVNCQVFSGSASAISVSSEIEVDASFISTSNTNAITGAGILDYSSVTFQTSSVINATTKYAKYTNLGKSKATGQPAFFAQMSAARSNVTGDGTVYTVACDTVIYDQDSNYNNGTYTFTAPVAGRYAFTAMVAYSGSSLASSISDIFPASGVKIYGKFSTGVVSDAGGSYGVTSAFEINMAASDTISMQAYAAGTTKTVSVNWVSSSDPRTFFAGHLIC